MPFDLSFLCKYVPPCNREDLAACLRNPGSGACDDFRECVMAGIEIRWLCRTLPELIPPLPIPGPDPVPFPGGGDPKPWHAGRFAGDLKDVLEAELLLEALAPSAGRHETALPSVVTFIRKEGLVPKAARNLAKRLHEAAELLLKEADLMEKRV